MDAIICSALMVGIKATLLFDFGSSEDLGLQNLQLQSQTPFWQLQPQLALSSAEVAVQLQISLEHPQELAFGALKFPSPTNWKIKISTRFMTFFFWWFTNIWTLGLMKFVFLLFRRSIPAALWQQAERLPQWKPFEKIYQRACQKILWYIYTRRPCK